MKNLTMCVWKKLGLAVVILAAGFCYSCGPHGETAFPLKDKGTVLAEAALGESAPELEDAKGAQEESGTPELDFDGGTSGFGGVSKQMEAYETSGESGAVQKNGGTQSPASCFVHVCGEVNAPDVYEMREGQRIYEAIERAGGFTENAAVDYLNLAEPVRDGMKLNVPDQHDVPKKEWEPERAGYGGVSGSGGTDVSSGGRLVNLNTATKEELMTLRGIGESRAEDILRYRKEHGGFQKIEDVMKISGIKDAAFQKIKDDITVSP